MGRRPLAENLRLRALLKALRPFAGTLIVVPLVVVFFGSHWSWERTVVPRRAWRVSPDTDRAESNRDQQEVRLHFYQDGSDPGRGVELGDGSVLLAELTREASRFQVVLQVDANDFFLVLGGPNVRDLKPLWKVRRERSESVLTTLHSPWLEVARPIRFLRVEGLRGVGARSVAGLRLDLEARRIPHVVLLPVLWGTWLLLWVASGRWRRARGLLVRWRRADLWLTAALIGAVVLRTPSILIHGLLAVIAIWAVLRLLAAWLVRSPASLLAAALALAASTLMVPRVVRSVLTTRLAQLQDLTVDHRPRPGGEINEDRLRFAGTADDLPDRDFVVLFLGDSFTFGETLEYDEAYPYVFERVVGDLDCTADVRSVDGGWVSSSPLLALRLLREIGPRYRPDLVLYSLDMTDFHDDLLYEQRLREGGDLEIDTGEALLQLVLGAFPALAAEGPGLAELRGLFRGRDDGDGGAISVPGDRFFVTAQPLEKSVEAIERGVMRNLAALHRLCAETLRASMALVIYPRAYQYSLRESPQNWEAHRYEPLGPWVREPFRYFEERADRLPYPVLSALEAFEESERFPLFQEDDPHWNAAGAALMAETVARWTARQGLIPCRARGESPSDRVSRARKPNGEDDLQAPAPSHGRHE